MPESEDPMSDTASTPIELVRNVYGTAEERAAVARERLGRPVTLAEKILFNHLDHARDAEVASGISYNDLRPDRSTPRSRRCPPSR